jgi:hypothetical protein
MSRAIVESAIQTHFSEIDGERGCTEGQEERRERENGDSCRSRGGAEEGSVAGEVAGLQEENVTERTTGLSFQRPLRFVKI